MSEYDAFGRKKDDAGLGDLGWGASDDPAAADSGFSDPQEFRTAVTTSGEPPRPRRRGRNPLVWLIQLALLGAIGFGIYAAVDVGNDAADTIRDTVDAFDEIRGGGGGGGTGGQGDSRVPDQVKPRNLFSPAGLRDAVRIMEKEVPGRIYVLSIRRDRINAQIIQGNQAANVGFEADAEVPTVSSKSPAPGGGGSLGYEEVNPQAPFKLLKTANQRVNRSPADVDYFVVSKFLEDVQWGVYYKGGSPIVQGDSRGRYTRRIS